MPPYIRLSADSCAACEKLVNERAETDGFSEGSVKVTLSVPKKLFSTAAAAPLKLEWPETYVGNGGVTISGVQDGSALVSAFPSVSAARMAVIGRQKLVSYLASQAMVAASAIATFSSANRRAFCERLLPLAAA